MWLHKGYTMHKKLPSREFVGRKMFACDDKKGKRERERAIKKQNKWKFQACGDRVKRSGPTNLATNSLDRPIKTCRYLINSQKHKSISVGTNLTPRKCQTCSLTHRKILFLLTILIILEINQSRSSFLREKIKQKLALPKNTVIHLAFTPNYERCFLIESAFEIKNHFPTFTNLEPADEKTNFPHSILQFVKILINLFPRPMHQLKLLTSLKGVRRVSKRVRKIKR